VTSKPDADKHIHAIATILDAWARYEVEPVPQGLLATRLETFPRLAPRSVRNCKRRLVDGQWMPLDGFVVAAPVTIGEPTLFPVALLILKKASKALELSVRIACFYIHDGKPQEIGWRFDLADPKPPSGSATGDRNRAHHFPHVQRVIAWKPGAAQGLSYDDYLKALHDDGIASRPATTLSGVNESRPAFPLRCSSASGLLITVMASLYGSTAADEILENAVPTLPAWLREEAVLITGR
jgi:hypothetical protein